MSSIVAFSQPDPLSTEILPVVNLQNGASITISYSIDDSMLSLNINNNTSPLDVSILKDGVDIYSHSVYVYNDTLKLRLSDLDSGCYVIVFRTEEETKTSGTLNLSHN